jgi:putative peptidoglycan lipid II flippase
VMVPIAVFAAVAREPIVTVLFGSGRMEAADLGLIALTLLGLLVGLTAHAMIAVLARAFYARQDTRTPVAAAILAVVVNSTLAGVFAAPLGLPGLALAIAIAAWLETAVLFVLLRRSLPELAIRPIVVLAAQSLVVTIGGSAAAAGVAAGLGLALGANASIVVLLVRIAIAGLVWLLTSTAIAAVLRIGELTSMIGLMADLIRRPRRA